VHGVIFTSFRDYLTAEHGASVAKAVFEGQPIFLLSESYDDSVLLELVGRAAAELGTEAGEVVHEFGRFTGQTTFTRLYPAFFAIAPSAREFLLTVETRIHELVRATIPNAEPPQLRVEEHGADGVRIVYSSPRRLCVLLRGLVQGTAGHYGESAEIDESTCMLKGEPSCTFDITLNPSASA
jgi:predicted hydrocarbon binding protein